eukprot:CAMPEP_0172874638 /NCGR_PEP_ID=MMETSP1075-20121228/98810_1 /TAXON_ID=2916 /ORGANISM="Ceratium fusus, Strain PA161109" /LENGTH=34 /DNA_ID= /DNA_START= /DNA_END= /DNA_ORIENTATION=
MAATPGLQMSLHRGAFCGLTQQLAAVVAQLRSSG